MASASVNYVIGSFSHPASRAGAASNLEREPSSTIVFL